MAGTNGDDVTVEVRLRGDRTRYAADETVHGTVIVRCARPRRCDYARVRLWWAAYGKQDRTDHTQVEDEVVFARAAELQGEQRWDFAVTIPAGGPTTFDGDTVWVTYSVTARIQWPDEDEPTLKQVKLEVEPTPLPLFAPVVGDPSGEDPAGADPLAVWRCVDAAALRERLGGAAPALSALASVRGRALRQRIRDRLGDVGAWTTVAVIVAGGAAVTLALVFGLSDWVFEPGYVLRKIGAAVCLGLLGWRLWEPARELVGTVRRRLHYGGVDIDFLSPPRFAAVGESPEVRVRVGRRARRPIERVAWELRVRQRAARIVVRTRRGSDYESTTWDHETTYVDGGNVDAPPAPDGAVTLRPTIPRGRPASLHLRWRRLDWELRVWVYSLGQRFTEACELQILPLRVPTVDEPVPVPEPGTPEVAAAAPSTGSASATPDSVVAAQPAPAADEPPEARRRRASFIVSRLRNARRGEIRSWFDSLLFVGFVLYPIGLTFLIFAIPPGTKLPLVVYVPLTLIAAVGVMTLVLLAPIFGLQALYHVGKAALLGPWRGLRFAAEKQAERRLLRDGHVPRDWFEGRFVRRRAVDRLIALEPDLVLDAEGLRPLSSGPPEGCPSCGAALKHPGPGLRRCGHCEFERFDPPPARSSALAAAERALSRIAGAPVVDRAELFRAFRRRKAPTLRTALVWSLRGVGVMFVCVVLAQLLGFTELKKPEGVALALFSIALVAGLAGACGLAWVAYRWLTLRFVEFRPGVLVHDLALRDEVLRVVAHQGQIGLDDLATHLGLPRARVLALVGRMAAVRRLPLYHDRANDRLVTAFAGTVGTSRCPSCGGRLEVTAGTRLTCAYCETDVKAA